MQCSLQRPSRPAPLPVRDLRDPRGRLVGRHPSAQFRQEFLQFSGGGSLRPRRNRVFNSRRTDCQDILHPNPTIAGTSRIPGVLPPETRFRVSFPLRPLVPFKSRGGCHDTRSRASEKQPSYIQSFGHWTGYSPRGIGRRHRSTITTSTEWMMPVLFVFRFHCLSFSFEPSGLLRSEGKLARMCELAGNRLRRHQNAAPTRPAAERPNQNRNGALSCHSSGFSCTVSSWQAVC